MYTEPYSIGGKERRCYMHVSEVLLIKLEPLLTNNKYKHAYHQWLEEHIGPLTFLLNV